MATATRSATTREQIRPAIGELVDAFNRNNLLTWASALAFQIVTSIVPFLLFGLGLLGFLSLGEVWGDLGKEIRPNVSAAAYTVIDDTANHVLLEKQLIWVTLGGALAIWQMSGGIRSIMGGLGTIYECEERRSWAQRIRRSIVLSIGVSTLVILAVAVTWLGPLVYGDVGQPIGALLFLARWVIAAALLTGAVALTLHFALESPQSLGWLSVGTSIVVGTWIAASILFGIYIRYIASYGSLFGNLATVVVLFAYVYISAIVFFAGAQVDAIIRRRVDGNARGA